MRTESFDVAGNLVDFTDVVGGINRTTLYEYDKRKRQIKIKDAEGGETHYSYYDDGQTKSVLDAAGNLTEYFYDEAGRLSEDKTLFGSRKYGYDLVNNRTFAEDRNGRVTNYLYDNLNRVKSEDWVNGGKTFSYAYDKNSNLIIADDGNIKYVYGYDDTDLVTRVDRVSGSNPIVSFRYGYDEIGNLTQTEELVGNVVNATTDYEYDDPRYLNTKIIQDIPGLAKKAVKFTYDPITGVNRKIERYLDGLLKLTTTNAFDPFGRLTGIEQKNGGGVIASSSYDLDALSRLRAETKNGLNRAIGYDDTDQVIGVSGSNSEGYTYDLNGNRTGGGYSTGAGNRLLSDGVYNYVYDDEGNRTSRTKISDLSVDLYAWDYRNRLTGIVSKTSITGTVTRTVGYEYDVDDQRVQKTVDGVVENYYLDGEQVAFVTDASGNQMFHYLYGLNIDQVLAQDSPAGMVWALADRLGTVDALTDGDGNVVDKRTFDSFGRILSETNPSVSFRYGYTGRERDLESGLDYYRARYYDPNVGRFISVDPAGFGAGDTNLYRYVGNNSTNATDPSGMIAPLVWAAIALGGATIGLISDYSIQSARKADNPNYEFNYGEFAFSGVAGAVFAPLGVAAAQAGGTAATALAFVNTISSLGTLYQAEQLSDTNNANEKAVQRLFGGIGFLTGLAGFHSGGGTPPSLGGAFAIASQGAALASAGATTALVGSLLGGAIGTTANDVFKHYFASDETTNNPGGNGTEPENRFGNDTDWEKAVERDSINVGDDFDILPNRRTTNYKGEIGDDGSPTRGIFRFITQAGQEIKSRISSIGAYRGKDKIKANQLIDEYKQIIIEEYGITDSKTIKAIETSLKHAEGRAALEVRINDLKEARLNINNPECYNCRSPIPNQKIDGKNGIKYILGEGNKMTVTSPEYRNGEQVDVTRSYTGMPKNVRR
jgi:RHS repeat-associated protein